MSLEELRDHWNVLYRMRLPELAKRRSLTQTRWPVYLDHCFARIVLDNAIGRNRPWNEALKAPATKNMIESQLKEAIALGEEIAEGKKDLVELDERSLQLRGKEKGGKRKRNTDEKQEAGNKASKVDNDGANKRSSLPASDEAVQRDLKSDPTPLSIEEYLTSPEPDYSIWRSKVRNHKGITTFRKTTLLLLTQVPRGRYTTYQILAESLAKLYPSLTGGKNGSARAIGGAMRNNPYAPEVPCHRVLATSGKLGGYGGDWDDGKKPTEKTGVKRKMLRTEGVKFDGKGAVVGEPFRGFKRMEV